MDTHTLYSAELNASALLYSAELSRTECLSMSIPIYSLPDWLAQIHLFTLEEEIEVVFKKLYAEEV